MGDDSGSSQYRDGCPFGVIGWTLAHLVYLAAWLVNIGRKAD